MKMNSLLKQINNFVNKPVKIYLKPGEKPPKGVQMFRGKRGGYFHYVVGGQSQQENVSTNRKNDSSNEYAPDEIMEKISKLGVNQIGNPAASIVQPHVIVFQTDDSDISIRYDRDTKEWTSMKRQEEGDKRYKKTFLGVSEINDNSINEEAQESLPKRNENESLLKKYSAALFNFVSNKSPGTVDDILDNFNFRDKNTVKLFKYLNSYTNIALGNASNEEVDDTYKKTKFLMNKIVKHEKEEEIDREGDTYSAQIDRIKEAESDPSISNKVLAIDSVVGFFHVGTDRYTLPSTFGVASVGGENFIEQTDTVQNIYELLFSEDLEEKRKRKLSEKYGDETFKSLDNITKQIDDFIKKFHPLHESKYNNPDTANRALNKIGSKRIKTIPREKATTKVYEHPEFGTFSIVEGKNKSSKIFHYPMSEEQKERNREYIIEGASVPKGKKVFTGPKGGRYYLIN